MTVAPVAALGTCVAAAMLLVWRLTFISTRFDREALARQDVRVKALERAHWTCERRNEIIVKALREHGIPIPGAFWTVGPPMEGIIPDG